MTVRQACNYVYALNVDGKTDEELDEFLEELNSPLDPKQREAERRWLRKG